MSITAGAWKRFCAVTQPARLAGALTFSAGLLMYGPVAAQPAAERVTVQLRSGERVTGALEDLEGGTLYIRVSLHDQRKIPIGEVMLIDREGGSNGVPGETDRARDTSGMVVLSNGTRLEGTLTDIEGGEGSGEPNRAREFVFRLPTGAERRLRAADVNRVYMAGYSGAVGTAGAVGTSGTSPGAWPSSSGASSNGRVQVSARERWVDTGLTVRQGQNVGFQTVGQVQLSTNGSDVANAAGSPSRTAANAPMPSVPAGALVGRIGPSGEPFAIGNLTSVAMPDSGRLFLTVNDDELGDNAGSYEVILTPGFRQR